MLHNIAYRIYLWLRQYLISKSTIGKELIEDDLYNCFHVAGSKPIGFCQKCYTKLFVGSSCREDAISHKLWCERCWVNWCQASKD